MQEPAPNLTNYEQTYRNFSWKEWEREFSFDQTGKVNYAVEVTTAQLERGNGNRPALISQKTDGRIERITFHELCDRTDRFAAAVREAGFTPGDRFALYAPRSIEYAIVLLGAMKAGAIAVPLFEAFGSDAVEDRLTDCGATWIYTTGRLEPNLRLENIPTVKHVLLPKDLPELLRHAPDPRAVHFGDLETPFILHYTSGSTAKPKGIVLPNRAMIGHRVTASFVLDLHPDDRYWNTGDPGWVTGMVYTFFAPLLVGVAAHIYEGGFHPLEWIEFMKKHRISVWYSTPTAFRLLRYYEAPLNRDTLPELRHIVSAGEPLNESLINWTQERLGIPIHDSWYMTENGHQLINNYRCLPINKGSMGRPLPGITAAILDETGREVPRRTVGRLAIKTPWPGLMKTVWNNAEKFESYFENDWYISGDAAYEDAEGYFWFQGRDDDMIKSAAERISPFEIESVLVAHPAVAEAGVIGKPHDLYGTIVKAFVLLRQGMTGSDELKLELMRHVKVKLSVHEVPREIEFVEKLPKTKSGKIMRRVLRARENQAESGDTSTMDVEMNPGASLPKPQRP